MLLPGLSFRGMELNERFIYSQAIKIEIPSDVSLSSDASSGNAGNDDTQCPLVKLVSQTCLNSTHVTNAFPLGVVVEAGFGCDDGLGAAQIISCTGYLAEGCLFGQECG